MGCFEGSSISVFGHDFPGRLTFPSLSLAHQAGRVCTIRDSRGDDEMAACGQLGNPQTSLRPAPILEPPEAFRGLVSKQQA